MGDRLIFFLKTFWSESSLILLTVLNSWPAVLLIVFFLIRKEIRGLIQSLSNFIDRIQKVKIANVLVAVCKDPKLPEEFRTQLLSEIEKIVGSFSSEGSTKRSLVFRCNGTKMVKNVSGDGTLFQVPFESCCIESKDGVFTAPQSGIYSVHWWVCLEGVPSQTMAEVQLQSSNKIFRFPLNNLASLKSDDGTVILYGTTLVEMDIADTVELAIEVGISEDSKTVHLAERREAYFSGYLVQVSF